MCAHPPVWTWIKGGLAELQAPACCRVIKDELRASQLASLLRHVIKAPALQEIWQRPTEMRYFRVLMLNYATVSVRHSLNINTPHSRGSMGASLQSPVESELREEALGKGLGWHFEGLSGSKSQEVMDTGHPLPN